MQILETLERMANHAHFHPSIQFVLGRMLGKDVGVLKSQIEACGFSANYTHVCEL